MTNQALHVARTGLDAQNRRMQVIANNLANVNTTGFKRDRASFETLAYQQIVAAGASSSAENKYATGLNLGTGVSMTGTERIDTQGSITTTGNSLDLSIEGGGFFQLELQGWTSRCHGLFLLGPNTWRCSTNRAAEQHRSPPHQRERFHREGTQKAFPSCCS